MNERTFRASEAAKLEDPARLIFLPPAEAMEILGLAPGMRVADIGAGTGHFAIPFARRVGPSGRVFAVDIQKEMLALLEAKIAGAADCGPIDLIEGTAAQTHLSDAACDLAFFSNVWHELDDREAVLAEAGRILRAGGRIAILDWRPDADRPPGPPADHRVSPAEVEALLVRCRWRVERSVPFGAYSYLITARPPGCG